MVSASERAVCPLTHESVEIVVGSGERGDQRSCGCNRSGNCRFEDTAVEKLLSPDPEIVDKIVRHKRSSRRTRWLPN